MSERRQIIPDKGRAANGPAFQPMTLMDNLNLTELSILIVEKRPTMITMLRGILRELGVRKVYEASTPESGFEEFNHKQPDMVFIDWGPTFDGIGLLHKIRTDANSNNPLVPVVMVTAHGEAERVMEARDAGMTEYLTKPVSGKRLYQRIAAVVNSDRSFIRNAEFFGPARRRHKKEHSGDERRGRAPSSDDETNNMKAGEKSED